MGYKLKKLKHQTIVITGATSGIGLVTAREAARRGARVMLISRDESDLRLAVDDIRRKGGKASYAVADVADFGALQVAARAAATQFDGIDTWVNNAGISIYGHLEEVPVDDARRLFETNYWGVVNGSLVAIPHLRQRGAGALINVGSVLSDTAMPLQGHYTASKHAVKGFTDALRLELEHGDAPISVSLIKPAAIDTPYPEHARSYLGVEPRHSPPVYAPEIVAKAILSCAERPRRDVLVGGAAKMFTSLETLSPKLNDRFKAPLFEQQRSREPDDAEDTLYSHRSGDGRERGRYRGKVKETSLYTRASSRPFRTLLSVAAVVGVAAAARSTFSNGSE